MSGEKCTDNRFEIIRRAKDILINGTNIETSPDEMKVLDNILFRCWQMGLFETSPAIKEEIKVINGREVRLYFDIKTNLYLISGELMEEIIVKLQEGEE